MTGMTTVRLYGKLGARFGRMYRLCLDTGSPMEAMRALARQLPGFEAEMVSSAGRGVKYAVFAGPKNVPADEITGNTAGADIRIAPVLAGAKRAGLFQVVLGAALVGLAMTNPGLIGIAEGAKLWTVGAASGMGLSLALGGVVQLISPQQKGLSAKDSPANGASYNFNGPVNTRAQGNPVPIGYGRMIIGSAVISAGIYAEDQS